MTYAPMYPHESWDVEFYKTYFDIPSGINASVLTGSVDIYIIAFNSLFCIEYQIRLLKTYFHFPNIIIIDNNCGLHPEISAKTKQMCEEAGVEYIVAPDNIYQHHFDPTLKLGTTMMWVYQQCVRKREPKYFGFIDQDAFLFKPFDVRSYLDQKGMYGTTSVGEQNSWNLHVTTNFFRYDFVKHLDLDFRAEWNLRLDTGGANYHMLYKHYDMADYILPKVSQNYFEKETFHIPFWTIQDGVWFHMNGLSHDMLKGNREADLKIAYTKGFLDSHLLQ